MRRLLVWLFGITAMLVLALAAIAFWFFQGAATDTVGKVHFDQRLKVPPLLEPRIDGQGRKVFDLRLQTGRAELIPGTASKTWGVNGPYLGPTIRASRGDRVLMKVSNRLPEATTLHWHGMHLPARADGGPHQMVPPRTTWKPSWRIDQPAATLWYHPHPHGATAEHVYRGLSGLFLLDDPEAAALTLPKRYGVDDIPLIVQDKEFRSDGSLRPARDGSSIGQLGDQLIVNGTSRPYVEVAHRRVRLRLLNASNARSYDFAFDDGRRFDLVATDGGLLERAHRTDHFQLSPGERAEVVVDFEPGERVTLRSEAPDLGANAIESRISGGDDRFDVLEVRAAERLAGAPRTPRRLVDHAPLRESDATRTRRFELNGDSRINGKTMDPGRIDETVEVGSTEIWEIRNAASFSHNFHIHDVRFKLLEYAGGRPPAHLAGWKDTVYVPPGERVRLLIRFTDYTDRSTPYMFHCHLLAHEDAGMMGQFVVVRPGERPPRRLPGTERMHRNRANE